MSEWSERLAASPVWKALEDLGPAIDNAEKREGVETPGLEACARMRVALAFIGKRLAAADPALVQPGPVDSIASHVQNAAAEVQQFTANGSPGHLANANAQIDSALVYLAQLNVLQGSGDVQAVREAADRYRDALEANAKCVSTAVAEVTRDATQVGLRLGELSSEMSAERQRLSSITADFQSQFSAAQDARSTEYNSAHVSRQEKFAELVAATNDALEKQTIASTRDLERIAQEHASALAELKKVYEDRAAELLRTIQGHRSDVEKLVGVIGNLGVTSGYLKTANEAKMTVRVWQGIGVPRPWRLGRRR